MAKLIHIPVTSPAFESYIEDGWRQISLTGLWATLRYEADRRTPSSDHEPTGIFGREAPLAHGDGQIGL